MNQAFRYLFFGQLSFLLFISICVLLKSQTYGLNTALSYYGTNHISIIPYAAALTTLAFSLIMAAQHLNLKKTRFIRLTLRVLAGLLIASLLTPYSINDTFFIIHSVIALFLFWGTLSVSCFIIVTMDHRPRNLLLVVLQLTAIVLIGLSPILHVQAIAEIASGLLFISLLYSTLKDIKEDEI